MIMCRRETESNRRGLFEKKRIEKDFVQQTYKDHDEYAGRAELQGSRHVHIFERAGFYRPDNISKRCPSKELGGLVICETTTLQRITV